MPSWRSRRWALALRRSITGGTTHAWSAAANGWSPRRIAPHHTLVASHWHLWRDLLAGHVGMDPTTLGRAFDQTRPDRSVGAFATEEEDTRAVLEAAGLTHDAEQVRELVRIEREFMTTG